MPSLRQNIRAALQAHLIAVPNAPTRVAYEGKPFEPQTGQPWIEPTLIPNPSRKASCGEDGLYLHEGTLQVGVVYPSGEGTAKAEAMADAITAAFKAGTALVADSVTVRTRYAERVGVAVEDASWIRVQVSIGWFLYATQNG